MLTTRENIRMDLKEIGIDMRNWVDSTQDRDYWKFVVNVALNLRFPAIELVPMNQLQKIWRCINLSWHEEARNRIGGL